MEAPRESLGDASDVIQPPQLPPTHRLLAGPRFESINALMEALNAWGRENGLGFVKTQASNYSEGSARRYTVLCDRGRSRPSEAHSRKTSTSKTGCPWRGVAKALKANGWLWEFAISKAPNDCHNHKATTLAITHATHRGLTDEMKAVVTAMSTNPAIRPREIYITLQNQYPQRRDTFTARDIENFRARLQRGKLGGLTASQAMLKAVKDKGYYCRVRYTKQRLIDGIEAVEVVENEEADEGNKDVDKKMIGLFWSYPWCQRIWQRFPYCLQLDNTYATNVFNMPLFQVTVVTHVGSIANIAFGLVDNEREDGFAWLLRQLDGLRHQLPGPTPTPLVVITDFEQALKNAISTVWPTAKQQLCVFHVNKNVTANMKKKWRGDMAPEVHDEDEAVEAPPEENALQDVNAPAHTNNTSYPVPSTVPHTRAGIYELWKAMVYTAKEEDFNKAWDLMKREFTDKPSILAYLQRYYLPTKEEWAACYISRNANFGQRTTSPTESSHRDLKSYLIKGTSSIFKLDEVIETMLGNKQQWLEQEEDRQAHRNRHEFGGQQWLGKIPTQVSYKAVDLMAKQKRIAMGVLAGETAPGPQRHPPQPCTGRFRSQYGLPCSHEIMGKLTENEAIQKADCHAFYWLACSIDPDEAFRRFQDPEKITNTKGRPRGTDPFASTAASTPVPTAPATSTPVTSAPVPSAPTAGMRHRPTQPSGRRKRSFWEISDDSGDDAAGNAKGNTKAKITNRTRRVGSKATPKTAPKAAPKTAPAVPSSPNPLQDYAYDSIPQGDTQSQIIVSLSDSDDNKSMDSYGKEEE